MISGTITQDLKYPMVGNVLTTRVTGLTVGNRVRWRVVSAPPGSAVPLWVEGEKPENWIDTASSNGCRFAPDVDGEYELEAVEETNTSYIPHYDGDGSTTQHPIDEWSEVTTETYSVYFGLALKKVLGQAPHTVVLRAWAHSTSSTNGVLTWWGDRNMAPVITDPSSTIALLAGSGAELLAELARLGGKGYLDTSATADILDAGANNFSMSPYSLAFLLATAFNLHCAYITDTVHGAADIANLMTLVAAPTDDASFITWVNTFATKYSAHIGTGIAVHPNGADVTNVIVSGAAATYSQAHLRLVEIQAKYEAHRVRIATGHGTMGDGTSASRMPHYLPPPTATYAFSSEMATYCALCADTYDNHLGVTGGGAGYHIAADSDNVVDANTVIDLASLKVYVNMLAKNISAHCLNIDSTTNAAAGAPYHTKKDYGADMSTVPRASDWASTIALLDKTTQIFCRHIDEVSGVHISLNPAAAYVQMYGANLLNKLFMDNVGSSTFGNPAGVFAASQTLLSSGGFGKA